MIPVDVNNQDIAGCLVGPSGERVCPLVAVGSDGRSQVIVESLNSLFLSDIFAGKSQTKKNANLSTKIFIFHLDKYVCTLYTETFHSQF